MLDYYHLSLHPRVDIEYQRGKIILYHQKLKWVFDSKSSSLDKFFHLLKYPGGTIDFFVKTLSASVNSTSIYYITQQLAKNGLLCLSPFDCALHPIVTLEPMSLLTEWNDYTSQLIQSQLVLSRFSYIRRESDILILESPLGNSLIYLKDPKSMQLIHLLATRSSFSELETNMSFLKKETLLAVLNLLKIANVITSTDETGGLQEDLNEQLIQWEFHDLLFHNRTRAGHHHYPLGKTYRFKEKTDPLPSLKTPRSHKTISLPIPDDKIYLKEDSLQVVLEKRRSIRNYGKKSITLSQLSEFLYRSIRVKKTYNATEHSLYQTTARPYPSGGASYELEFYLCLERLETVKAGLYHYDPAQHALNLISTDDSSIDKLSRQSELAMGSNNSLDVLIIITARFGRVNWQYESIAYSLILKNVGVIYQTFYLVATAMGLAPCALGSGDSPLFSQIAGLNGIEETSVGEFSLGIEV